MQKASKRAVIRAIRRGFALLSALIFILSALCCAPEADPNAAARREVFAMDTYMNISCYGKGCEAAADAAVAEIKRIDALLSISSESGSIHGLNQSGSADVGGETALIIMQALKIHSETGAFDITVLPLMEIWGFTSGEYRVPSKSEIDAVLAQIGSEKLSVSGSEVSLGGASGVDLGGIAKGYTSNRLTELFKERGLTSACVSLGGNVQCLGGKPDGSAWRCGIVHPFKKDSGEYLGIVSVKDKAVITSGAYERNFTDESGRLYHHIIDPKTGYPAESGLASVTIVSESGVLADALSTACYIMGLEDAISYWRNSSESFDMILMSEDGKVFVTSGIAGSFTSELEVYSVNR
ncbi:MAG: FAD:protein FMN transferase [Clostridia bacterium]|nr:FAD:protein FMN transferase [Clostridia bacterium]